VNIPAPVGGSEWFQRQAEERGLLPPAEDNLQYQAGRFLGPMAAAGVPRALEAAKNLGVNAVQDYMKSAIGSNPYRGQMGAVGSIEEKPRVLTLFSGGGSYEQALKGKVRPVGAVEFDPAIGGHYRNVHGEHVQVKDVREVDFTPFRGQVDIMHASPVCKRASAAKCAAGEQELDMDTAQATARALGEVEPAVFTLENVPQYQKFGAFKVITDKLDELGYNWDVVRYDAARLGAPSRRDRIMLRASKGQLPPAPGAAAPAAQADWFSAVEDLLPTMPRSNLANWQRQRLMAQGINPDALERPLLVGGGSGMKGTIPAAQQGGPAWTIKATAKELGGDRIVMPGGETYTLTPRAYARLLGLPDEYPLPDDARLAKTIVGNAMAPAMTREVMEPFLKMLAGKGVQ
jgi:DNA (cytosine-5)-methyltransferase 1